MLAPRFDRRTKAGMFEKPIMKAGRRTGKGEDGDQEKRRGGQERQRGPRDSQRGGAQSDCRHSERRSTVGLASPISTRRPHNWRFIAILR